MAQKEPRPEGSSWSERARDPARLWILGPGESRVLSR